MVRTVAHGVFSLYEVNVLYSEIEVSVWHLGRTVTMVSDFGTHLWAFPSLSVGWGPTRSLAHKSGGTHWFALSVLS